MRPSTVQTPPAANTARQQKPDDAGPNPGRRSPRPQAAVGRGVALALTADEEAENDAQGKLLTFLDAEVPLAGSRRLQAVRSVNVARPGPYAGSMGEGIEQQGLVPASR
jgi:hypothetical protein